MSKITIELTKSEANAFYKSNIGNDCPLKYFIPFRKIFWTLSTNNNPLSYTVCQNCYHNNKFGDKDISIKDKLKPYMVINAPCNCDGITNEKGLPINVNNKWLMGIYSINNSNVSLLNSTISYKNNILYINSYTSLNRCNYSIYLYSLIPHSPFITIETYDHNNRELYLPYNATRPYIIFDDKYNETSMLKNHLIFDNENTNNLNNILIRIFELTPTGKNKLIEFYLSIKHISCINKFNDTYNHKKLCIDI